MNFKFTVIIPYYFGILDNTEIVNLEQIIDLVQKWVYPDSIVNKDSNASLWLQKVAK